MLKNRKVKGYFFLHNADADTGAQVFQPVSQPLFQHCILGLAGAVTREIPGGKGLQLSQGLSQLPAIGGHFDEMKAAAKGIWPEPMQNVQHTLVGAAAEADLLSLFFYQQILLMQIGILLMDTVLPDALSEYPEGTGPAQCIAAVQGEALCQLQSILHRDQPGISCQAGIQPNVFSAAEIFSESMPAQINRRMAVDFQKPFQSATVVVMTVGQDAQIHLGQVNTQGFGIVRKGTGLSGVEQYFLALCLDVQAQAMFSCQLRTEGGIFNQYRYFHIVKLKSRCSGRFRAG